MKSFAYKIQKLHLYNMVGIINQADSLNNILL